MTELKVSSTGLVRKILFCLLLMMAVVLPETSGVNVQNGSIFSPIKKLQTFSSEYITNNYVDNSFPKKFISRNQSWKNFVKVQKKVKNYIIPEKRSNETFWISISFDDEIVRKLMINFAKSRRRLPLPRRERSIGNGQQSLSSVENWNYLSNGNKEKRGDGVEIGTKFFEVGNNDGNDSQIGNEQPRCRTRDGRFLPSNLFGYDTCVHCYHFEVWKKPGQKPYWKTRKENFMEDGKEFSILVLLNSTDSNHTETVNYMSDYIFRAVEDLKLRENWRRCCAAASECCSAMQTSPISTLPLSCPRTWDGWQCWGDAAPGTTSFEPCPSYSYIETTTSCTKSASKHCLEDGSWFRRGRSEWSDYSSCGQLHNIRLRFLCHVFALTMSTVALIPALLIFSCYRQLHVHRITLHKQLFISLLFESSCSISFRLIELYGVEVMQQNPPWCVALCLVRKYARLTNYMWYLCEGFYLHRLLASAFAEQRSLFVFYFIGWVFPVLPLTLYALLRGLLRENSHCWSIPMEGLEWIFQVPPLLAILINLLFIVNIIRILLGKVRATHDCEPSQFRMAVRATLMVVPLFGLQYIVTIYRPTGGACVWIDAYHVINNIIDGSTGLVVSIIFCYSNGEVRTLLRRNWQHFQENHAPFLPQRLQRSFRLRSLTTVQTTLVDMNPPCNITRKNSAFGTVKNSSKQLVSFLKKSSTSPHLPSTDNSISDSGKIKNSGSISPAVEHELIVQFIDNNKESPGQHQTIWRSPSCSGLLL